MTFTCKSGKFFENYEVNFIFTLSFIYFLSQLTTTMPRELHNASPSLRPS